MDLIDMTLPVNAITFTTGNVASYGWYTERLF